MGPVFNRAVTFLVLALGWKLRGGVEPSGIGQRVDVSAHVAPAFPARIEKDTGRMDTFEGSYGSVIRIFKAGNTNSFTSGIYR